MTVTLEDKIGVRTSLIRDISIFALLVVIILFRYFLNTPDYHNGERVRITSNILSDPIDYPSSTFIKIAGLKAYLTKGTDVSYGDRIVVEGVVKDGKLEDIEIEKVQKEKTPLSSIRNAVIGFYQEVLPEPMSGLMSGIVLGAKGALDLKFYDLTKNVGVAHVVVASGTNISFVVSFLFATLTLFISRRKAMLFVIFGIVLYLFVSGFDAPLIRAAIMASTLFVAQITGRAVSSLRVLVMTALIMLVFKPSWIGDIGFILSFVSTLSLIVFEKKIRNYLKKVPKVLKEGLSTSLAAQIGVSPILFVTFGQFNILSPLINALVLWTIPYIIILGAIGGIIGVLFPLIGKVIIYLSYPLLWWFVHIVTLFNF